MSGISISLGKTPSNMELLMAKAKAGPSKSAKPKLTFDDEEEDDDAPDTLGGPSTSGGLNKGKGKGKAKPNLHEPPERKPSAERPVLLSRAERKAQEAALALDASVFDYDGVYEDMKAAEKAVEEAKAASVDKTKPKYIESFLAAAQTRKLDRLRAEEKMLQREREKEGDEFEDKEKFVTEAYKKQMEEVRKAEEEEKAREGECALCSLCNAHMLTSSEALKKSNRGPGLTTLYKSMLEDDAEKRVAAMAAASGRVVGPSLPSGPSLAIRPPPGPTKRDEDEADEEEEYDPFLAREAKASAAKEAGAQNGKTVEVNDDGEVVDKRTLLKPGLNITKKPSPAPSSLFAGQRSKSTETDQPYVSRAVGTAASYKERMERERRRLAEQVREQEERRRERERQEQEEAEERARRRREGADGEAEKRRQEARERFLARKREREAAKEGANKKGKVA